MAATAKAQDAAVDANRSIVESAARTVQQRQAQLAQVKSRLAQYRSNAPALVAIRQANVQSQQANQQTAQAMLEQAELKLSYTKIVAPAAGIVLKRSAEVGERINAGQQLLMIAQIGDIWVTADFKETQMHNIHPGQSVRLHVDALQLDFEGYVDTIGGSTGAIASVLPPENATGNYIKVVQRIPVRLRFKPNQNGSRSLAPRHVRGTVGPHRELTHSWQDPFTSEPRASASVLTQRTEHDPRRFASGLEAVP